MAVFSRRGFIRNASALLGSQQFGPMFPSLNAAIRDPHPDTSTGMAAVIDTHIHLYDPRRSGGIPWPEKTNRILYRPALPARYHHVSEPFGIVGAIAIECSPLFADNDWLLGTAKSNRLIVGVIGDLDLALPEFPRQLEHLCNDPLFRGIRYGNLWGRDLGLRLKETLFVDNLKLLAGRKLVLESANPDPALVANLLQITALAPDLQIILDHLPQAVPPKDS